MYLTTQNKNTLYTLFYKLIYKLILLRSTIGERNPGWMDGRTPI